LETFFDIVLHLDVHLNEWVAALGVWSYFLLFVILFCETGLVVTPFLPGDSLLFAIGALCATHNAALDLMTVGAVLLTAAILGDAMNYSIGRKIGPKIFTQKRRWLNTDHLLQAQAFYEKYGGLTIVLARFLPIVRTFAPFVAGITRMNYSRFSFFNVFGAMLWVISLLLCGYFLGSIPFVKKHFEIIIIIMIILPGLPVLFKVLKQTFTKKRKCS